MRESGEEDLRIKLAVDKPLSVNCPNKPLVEVSDPTKADEAYIEWIEVIDLSHTHRARSRGVS